MTLEVKGKTATGTFVTYEYGEEIPTRHAFHRQGDPDAEREARRLSGNQLRRRAALQRAAQMRSRLIWHLKIVNRQTHLFIPMHQRNYETTPPKWIVADVELEATKTNAPRRNFETDLNRPLSATSDLNRAYIELCSRVR